MFLRFSFPEGITLQNIRRLNVELSRIVFEYFSEAQLLLPGEYDITPPSWGNRSVQYRISVKEDETLECRISGNERVVGMPPLGFQEQRQGPRMIRMPHDQRILSIIAPKGTGSNMRFSLFELIVCVPDRHV